MHVVEPPVSTGLILICEKCGKRMKADFAENPSRELVARLKKESKAVFQKGEVRAALTSCLDICPDERLAVAIVPTGAHMQGARYFTVAASHPRETGEVIVKEARKVFLAIGQVND